MGKGSLGIDKKGKLKTLTSLRSSERPCPRYKLYPMNIYPDDRLYRDLSRIVAIAKNNKIYTAIDNTWGTPYFLKPIKLGFDMSIVSATKYYSGHSDVMGGSLAINNRVFKLVERTSKVSGLRLGPDDAYLITRGLRTLDLRLDKHQENARKVAAFLSKNKKIKLLYPYKKDSFNFRMWKKYYSGASGLMGLRIKAKNKKSIR